LLASGVEGRAAVSLTGPEACPLDAAEPLSAGPLAAAVFVVFRVEVRVAGAGPLDAALEPFLVTWPFAPAVVGVCEVFLHDAIAPGLSVVCDGVCLFVAAVNGAVVFIVELGQDLRDAARRAGVRAVGVAPLGAIAKEAIVTRRRVCLALEAAGLIADELARVAVTTRVAGALRECLT
jgi:hypothetical protein